MFASCVVTISPIQCGVSKRAGEGQISLSLQFHETSNAGEENCGCLHTHRQFDTQFAKACYKFMKD